MNPSILLIDDKHVPIHRIVWVAGVPHFCGEEDCTREGDYEVRLDVDDSLWINRTERDVAVQGLHDWYNGLTGHSGQPPEDEV